MIVEEEIRESKRSSFTKTIDEASRSMMMHALQGGNYVYPIKSAVRETASNCVDSHIEKEIAINILNGNAKSSDYYEDIKDDEGIRYASGFD
ncbi:MAG: hypothetical protein KAH32_00135, partial [Chlamydiia bacterium]|nr:hypothetical protein [Chlamydiia bacterium]